MLTICSQFELSEKNSELFPRMTMKTPSGDPMQNKYFALKINLKRVLDSLEKETLLFLPVCQEIIQIMIVL